MSLLHKNLDKWEKMLAKYEAIVEREDYSESDANAMLEKIGNQTGKHIKKIKKAYYDAIPLLRLFEEYRKIFKKMSDLSNRYKDAEFIKHSLKHDKSRPELLRMFLDEAKEIARKIEAETKIILSEEHGLFK